jgi:hypothetical protein
MGKLVRIQTDSQAARTATFNGATWGAWADGQVPAKISAFMDVTAVSGTTPSMTVKFQYSYDGTNFTDVTSGAFSAATVVSVKELNGIAYPGGAQYTRYVATISGTTPSFTFTLKLLLHD